MPLTADRAKPAVPFGGVYRLVDFALSNLVNARYLRIVVLTQYKSHSLDRHISQAWRMSTLLGNYIAPVPAQQRVGKRWYLGSADAIFQSLNLVRDERPDIVVVVGADHVYRMDFAPDGRGARRVAARRARSPRSGSRSRLADQFGVIQALADDPRRIAAFLEKPTNPAGPAGRARPGARLDGQLRLRRRRPRRRGHPGRRPRGVQARHGRRHRARLRVPRRGRRLRLHRQRRARLRRRATATTGATSGRSTPTSRPRWTSSRCTRCSTSTTTSGRSTPTSAPGRPRSSCTAGTAGSGTR